VWNETVKKLAQKQAPRHPERAAADPEVLTRDFQRAKEFGLADALGGGTSNFDNYIAALDAKDDHQRRLYLESAYDEGYKKGLEKRKAVLNRARELGMNDAKADQGMAHLAEITHWPEFYTMGQDIQEAYTDGFAESQKARADAPKDAVLKRAGELASNDAKAGKGMVHLAEI